MDLECFKTVLSVARVTDPEPPYYFSPGLFAYLKEHSRPAQKASAFLSFGPERITPPPPPLALRSAAPLQRTGEISLKTHAILRADRVENEQVSRDMLPGEIHQVLFRAEVEPGAYAAFKVTHRSQEGKFLGEQIFALLGAS
jgi:hypothetical protein